MESNKVNLENVLQIVVKAEVKPGREASFEQAFQKAAEPSRKEEGNLSFQLFKVHDKIGQYIVLESWIDGDALHDHMEKEHTKSLFQSLSEDLSHHVTEHLSVTSELFPSI